MRQELRDDIKLADKLTALTQEINSRDEKFAAQLKALDDKMNQLTKHVIDLKSSKSFSRRKHDGDRKKTSMMDTTVAAISDATAPAALAGSQPFVASSEELPLQVYDPSMGALDSSNEYRAYDPSTAYEIRASDEAMLEALPASAMSEADKAAAAAVPAAAAAYASDAQVGAPYEAESIPAAAALYAGESADDNDLDELPAASASWAPLSSVTVPMEPTHSMGHRGSAAYARSLASSLQPVSADDPYEGDMYAASDAYEAQRSEAAAMRKAAAAYEAQQKAARESWQDQSDDLYAEPVRAVPAAAPHASRRMLPQRPTKSPGNAGLQAMQAAQAAQLARAQHQVEFQQNEAAAARNSAKARRPQAQGLSDEPPFAVPAAAAVAPGSKPKAKFTSKGLSATGLGNLFGGVCASTAQPAPAKAPRPPQTGGVEVNASGVSRTGLDQMFQMKQSWGNDDRDTFSPNYRSRGRQSNDDMKI